MQPNEIILPQWIAQFTNEPLSDVQLAVALLRRGGSVEAKRRSSGVDEYHLLVPISVRELLAVMDTVTQEPLEYERSVQFDGDAVSVALVGQQKNNPYCVARIRTDVDTAIDLLGDLEYNRITEQYDMPMPAKCQVTTLTMRLIADHTGVHVRHIETLQGDGFTTSRFTIAGSLSDVVGRPNLAFDGDANAALAMYNQLPYAAQVEWWDAALAWHILDALGAAERSTHAWYPVEWLWVGSSVAEAQIRLLTSTT